MTREEHITFIVQAVYDIEGEVIDRERFDKWSDDAIKRESAWLEYLLDK